MGAAIAISPDELAYQLSEVNLQSPDSSGWHRYQYVYVNRGDRLAEHRIDLGPAENFPAEQFRLLGGGHNERTGRYVLLYTVAELQDIANKMREEPTQVQRGNVVPRDIWGEYREANEEGWKRKAHQSVFGPDITVQRN